MANSSNRVPNLINPFNISKLFTPIKHYVYFEQYSDYAFNSGEESHDKRNAWCLAELSGLIYFDEGSVRQQLKSVFAVNDSGIEWLDSSKTDTKPDTQGLIVELNDCFIIVFRGTEFYAPGMLTWSRLRSIRKDVLSDLDYARKPDQIKNIPVHSGFHDALQDVWGQIEAVINRNDKPLYLTGHSMGGAIAAIAAMRLSHRVNGLYTFGMPCAGGQELSTYCAQHLKDKCFRYVNENDIIVSVMRRILKGYQLLGEEKIIRLKKRNNPFEFFGDIFKSDIIDHSPIYYMLGTRLAL